MKAALQFLAICCFSTACFAADFPRSDAALTLSDLAIFSEAVVVARVGSFSAEPARSGGAVALWIERMLKGGRLRANRDIIWVPGNQLPHAEAGQLYLLFLTQLGDGSWIVQTGGSEKNLIRLKDAKEPVLAEVSKAVGSYGPPADTEMPADGEVCEWIKKAAHGSREAKREAYDRLISAGGYARADLLNVAAGEREEATVAQTVLPLITGGPVANGLRLGLEPAVLEIDSDEPRNLQVNFANVSDHEIRIVTGTGAHGDVVVAASAYEIRPLGNSKLNDRPGASLLPTVLPQEYGAAIPGKHSPLPNVHSISSRTALPLAVKLELERDAAKKWVLKFPHGYVELPGPGRYGMRVRFACPGPRPDQERLMALNYWAGGQLVSNEIELVVK